MQRTTSRVLTGILLLAAAGATGCPPPQHRWLGAGESRSSVVRLPDDDVRASRGRLDELRNERTAAGLGTDYRVGPGDLVKISVFDLNSLDRTVRISASGAITLPLIGTQEVTGLTEQQLEEAIASRLEGRYLKEPQVSAFVEEYKSQRVAVLGAVLKPGQYTLTKDKTTVLDMISEAGGLARDAGARIYLLPGERTNPTKVAMLTASAKMGVSDAEVISDGLAGSTSPIVVDVHDILDAGTQAALTLPARDGDVIIVPESGQFLVDGWVEKPGAYALSRGATVLAALTAAGGPLYPAATEEVQVVRNERSGRRTVLNADVPRIIDGQTQDIPLEAGDIVYVPASAVKLPIYAVYTFVTNVFRIAGTIPVI